jgi:hypothetical protein
MLVAAGTEPLDQAFAAADASRRLSVKKFASVDSAAILARRSNV